MKSKPHRGRPVGTTADRPLLNRHVVNVDDATEKSIVQYCRSAAILRTTDGIRSLIVKALRAEGRPALPNPPPKTP